MGGWVYSNTNYPSTPATYEWRSTNLYNQHCAAIGSIPAGATIRQLRIYAAARNNVVTTYACLWSPGSSILRYSSSFSMAVGSESGGGQYWYTKTITDYLFSAGGTLWVGLYRNPNGGHIFGRPSSPGANAYEKTNTSSFPSVVSMSGYNTDSDDEVTVGLFYIEAPAAPTSASVTRVSDSQQNISFTNNSTTGEPYDSIKVERYDNVTGSYYQIASISGSANSYNDTSTAANKRYRYRIRAYNTSGYSSYVYTDYIRTTPAAPTSVVASRSGTSVVVTWIDNATSETNQTIQRKTSADNVTWTGYSTLSSSIAANTTSYNDSSPANYNQYKVKADCTDPTLSSAYTESNVIVVIQPPDAPTGLSPTDSTAIDAANANTFSWVHNPLDGTAQTKFSLQYRVSGDAWPGTPQYDEIANTDEFVEIAGSTFTNGTTYEWQVKLWGQATTGGTYGDGSSDWSDTSTFLASETPVATITNPTAISNYAYSDLIVTWDYTQGDSKNQTEFICQLFDSNDALLETIHESSNISSGSSDTATFTTVLTNNTTYTVNLLVKSSADIWSTEVEVEFTTEFLEPLTPTITLEEDETNGRVNIGIVNPSIEVVYPINSTQDTYINSTYSGANYNNNGQLDLLDDTGSGTDKSLILLDFDFSQFAGDTIVSADLFLFRKYALTPGIHSTINYIKTAFDEAIVTYATIPTLDATDYDDHAHSAGDSEVWNIASLVQDIIDGVITDYEGLAVVPSTTDGSADYFFDSTVTNYEPEIIVEISPRNAETSYNSVYRSVDGGSTWELVETNITANTTISDNVPNIGGNTSYYAQAISTLPSSKNSVVSTIECIHTGYFYLNGGNGYEDFVKLRGDVDFNEKVLRDTTVKKRYGRTRKVKYQGENIDHTLNFSCELLKSQYSDFIDILETIGDHLFRDWNGRYMEIAILDNKINKKDNDSYQVQIYMERVDNDGA